MSPNSEFGSLLKSFTECIKSEPDIEVLMSSGDVLSKVAETLCFMQPDKTNIEFLMLASKFFYVFSRIEFDCAQLEDLLLQQIVIPRLTQALTLCNEAFVETQNSQSPLAALKLTQDIEHVFTHLLFALRNIACDRPSLVAEVF